MSDPKEREEPPAACPSRSLCRLDGQCRHEPLTLAVEGQGDIPRLAVPALQVLQDNTGRGFPFALVVVGPCQNEGVVAPIFKLAGFAEARQAQPLAVTQPHLRILRASQGGDDDDRNPGVGELAEIVHRRIDRPAAASVVAWRADPLDVIDQDQTGIEGVGR